MEEITSGTAVALFLVVLAIVFAFKSVNVIPQQTAWVIERLGKFHKVLNPGLNFIIPFIDKVAYKHSLKEILLIPQVRFVSPVIIPSFQLTVFSTSRLPIQSLLHTVLQTTLLLLLS